MEWFNLKIFFYRPPHSGKSVFIANLIDKMPTDAYTIIRACPDGEGTWSNNKNQNETTIVRKKGKFKKSFIDDACQAIDNQSNIFKRTIFSRQNSWSGKRRNIRRFKSN